MDNQILLAGGVTAVVGVAVTAMWYFENNMGSSRYISLSKIHF
jgi:hypothetical protein